MQCPRCGSHTRVKKTRGATDSVRRVRECLSPACGFERRTLETDEDAPVVVFRRRQVKP